MKHRKLYLKTRTAIFAVIILSFIAIGNGLLLDKNTSNPSSSASAAYPADINSDGKVDVSDLSTLVGKWGTTDALSDINKDGTVNIFDLSMLISKWGVVPTTTTKPDATNTGVPAGITLRSITTAYPDAATKGYTVNTQGRVTITKDGGIYEGVIFPAGVVVKAKNVIIRNSLIEGGRSSFANMIPEPTSWDHCRQIYLSGQSAGSPQLVDANSSLVVNLLIEDSEIRVKPTDYSVYVNNYMGHDTTMRRVNMSGGVDAIGIHNAYASTANFTIEDSYIHDLYKGKWSPGNYNIDPTTSARMYCGYDASHPEGSHSDGIQMHDGSGVFIRRNSFFVNQANVTGTNTNAGIMMNNAGNVHVESNYFRYGVCSINMVSGLTLPVEVINNTFYGNNGPTATGTQGSGSGNCAIIRPSSTTYTFTNNLWENGTAVSITGGN